METNGGEGLWTERRSSWSSCRAQSHSADVLQSYKVCGSGRWVFFPMVLTLNLVGKNPIEWPHSLGESDTEASLQECFQATLLSLNWTFSSQNRFLLFRGTSTLELSRYIHEQLLEDQGRSGWEDLFLYFYLFTCFSSVSSLCFRADTTHFLCLPP